MSNWRSVAAPKGVSHAFMPATSIHVQPCQNGAQTDLKKN